jgi:hypothetical protein
VSDVSARKRGDQWSLRRPLIGMFVLATVVAGGWLVREPVLIGAANLWIVSDPVSRADAIVVLGGGLATRPFVAAEMWRRGLADKILISQAPEERAVSIGAMPSHAEPNREILLKSGVPAGAIETFGTANIVFSSWFCPCGRGGEVLDNLDSRKVEPTEVDEFIPSLVLIISILE